MEKKTIISKLLVALLLLVAVNTNAQVLGTERINYENTTLNGGGVWSIDSIAAYTARTQNNTTIATANGFSSSKVGNVITLTATPSGILKSNGTAMSAAVAGDFPTLNQSTTGNAATATLASTVTTNANLTGPVTSVGNATSIATGAITNTMIAANTIDLTAKVTGILPLANGGTGSSTQNFVDLSTTQASIAGAKTFTGGVTSSGATTLSGSTTISNQIITPPASTSTGATLTIGTGINNQPINSTSTTTVTITAGATAGRVLKIQVLKTSTGSVVINSSGAETFNGGSSWTLAANSQNSKIVLELIGTDYQVTFQ